MVTKTKTFVNEPATVLATIEVAKRISGRDGKTGDTFTFVLTPKHGAPMPAGDDGKPLASLTTTVEMDEVKDGDTEETSFAEIPVPIPSDGSREYMYTLAESGDNRVEGLEYSQAKYTVTVQVNAERVVSIRYTQVNDDQGETVQNPASSEQVPVFTNTLKRLTASQMLVKSIDGRKWREGDSFTFLVKPVGDNAASAPAPVNAVKGGNSEKGWQVVLGYDQAKCGTDPDGLPECWTNIDFDVPYPDERFQYTYEVIEVVPENTEPGMVYSKARWIFSLQTEYSSGDGFQLYAVAGPEPEKDDDGNPVTVPPISAYALANSLRFVNRVVTVSALPLTGGGSTARTLLLSGGGVLLVAGAAWLLARRRRV